MTHSAEQAAVASVALWIVHTVDCAAYARRTLTGPPTSAKEPGPANAAETKMVYDYACALTERLHERAKHWGLTVSEIDAGRDFVQHMPWPLMIADYPQALSVVGGRLSPA